MGHRGGRPPVVAFRRGRAALRDRAPSAVPPKAAPGRGRAAVVRSQLARCPLASPSGHGRHVAAICRASHSLHCLGGAAPTVLAGPAAAAPPSSSLQPVADFVVREPALALTPRAPQSPRCASAPAPLAGSRCMPGRPVVSTRDVGLAPWSTARRAIRRGPWAAASVAKPRVCDEVMRRPPSQPWRSAPGARRFRAPRPNRRQHVRFSRRAVHRGA
jgi:hypothetical protein